MSNRDRWRRVAVVTAKLIRFVISLANAAAILHIFYAGDRGRRSRWTRLTVMLAFIECVFVANPGRCPLTGAVENLGADLSDIFLPRWFAERIPQLFTPPLVIGVVGLMFHDARQSRPALVHQRDGRLEDDLFPDQDPVAES